MGLRIAPGRVAPAAAARGLQTEYIAGRDLDTGYFGRQNFGFAAGGAADRKLAARARGAALQAIGRMREAVEIG